LHQHLLLLLFSYVVLQMWIWYLYDALRNGKAGITTLSDPNGGYFPCITSYTTTWNS
jgi:hypothetical protein